MNEKANPLSELLLGFVASYGMNALGAIVTLIVGFVAAAGWRA